MDEHISNFLKFLSAEKGASDNTIAAYRNDLSQFQEYLGRVRTKSVGGDWRRVEKLHVALYVQELKGLGRAEASISRKVSSVKSFFQFLRALGAISTNPIESLETPPKPKMLLRWLTVEQIQALLEEPMKHRTPVGLRDTAMVQLLYTTGLRVSELVALNMRDVSLYARGSGVRCYCKGRKEPAVRLNSSDCYEALLAYLKDGRPNLAKENGEQAFFINSRGNRLRRNHVWQIIKQYARDAGLPRPVTLHLLRNSFAIHLLASGIPLREVQQMLDHANIWTTRIYELAAEQTQHGPYETALPQAQAATL